MRDVMSCSCNNSSKCVEHTGCDASSADFDDALLLLLITCEDVCRDDRGDVRYVAREDWCVCDGESSDNDRSETSKSILACRPLTTRLQVTSLGYFDLV